MKDAVDSLLDFRYSFEFPKMVTLENSQARGSTKMRRVCLSFLLRGYTEERPLEALLWHPVEIRSSADADKPARRV